MTDILNLALGAGNAPATPVPTELIGGQPAATDALNEPTPMAFSEALLNVVNTLMVGQGKGAGGSRIDAQALRQKADENADDEAGEEASLLRADAHQQLLDALLMPHIPPFTPVESARLGESSTAQMRLPQMSAAAGVPTAGAKPPVAYSAVSVDSAMPAKADVPPTQAMSLHQASPQLMTVMTAVAPELATQPASATQVTNAASPQSHPAQSGNLKLDTEDSRWSQQLQRVLGERLQVQVKNQIQHATIRLDPPEMGKIDISLQIDSGRMQVQINASHAEVYRALQQTSNDLRQSLTEQNFVQVNVQVSSQSGGQQQNQGSRFAQQQAAIQSALEIAPGTTVPNTARREDDSVLLTV